MWVPYINNLCYSTELIRRYSRMALCCSWIRPLNLANRWITGSYCRFLIRTDMIKAVFSKVLLGSSVQNGLEWKKSGIVTRQTWCHGSGWGKESLRYSDGIRDRAEAKDTKVLRCIFVPKKSKKIKIIKDKIQMSKAYEKAC